MASIFGCPVHEWMHAFSCAVARRGIKELQHIQHLVSSFVYATRLKRSSDPTSLQEIQRLAKRLILSSLPLMISQPLRFILGPTTVKTQLTHWSLSIHNRGWFWQTQLITRLCFCFSKILNAGFTLYFLARCQEHKHKAPPSPPPRLHFYRCK